MTDSFSEDILPKTTVTMELPINKDALKARFTEDQLKDLYVNKCVDPEKQISKISQEVFESIIDRILGGYSEREISKWLREALTVELHPNAIKQYIREFLPESITQSLSITDESYRDSYVDEVQVMENCVRLQRERVAKLKQEVKSNPSKSPILSKAIQLLFKMSNDLLEKKQSMGTKPRVPEAVTHSIAGLENLSPESAAKILDILKQAQKESTGPTSPPAST